MQKSVRIRNRNWSLDYRPELVSNDARTPFDKTKTSIQFGIGSRAIASSSVR